MLHVSLLQTLISNSQFLKPAITWFLLFERTEQWISWWYSTTYTCYPFCRKGLERYGLKRALIYTLCHLLKYLSRRHLGLQFLLLSFSRSVVSDSLQPPRLQGDPTSPFWRRSALEFLWKEWCQSWNSSTLATSCEELTHWKRLWCWEGLGTGGEGDDRGWDGWMASLTRWTWVWVNSGSWWRTWRPGVLRFMGSQRVGHDWATELNWTVTFKFSVYGYI